MKHSKTKVITSMLRREFSARCNVNALNALHIAAACRGEVSFFITCDDEVVNKKTCIEKLAAEREYKLKVRNPINYLRERWRG